MKDFGEIPGGKNELKSLLFPFHRNFPFRIWSKYRWWKNNRLKEALPKLNRKNKWITVIDRLGAPGDALITSNIIHSIKQTYENLKINCISPHPELIELDPSIDAINRQETFYSFDSSYWDLIVRKEKNINIVKHNLEKLGISEYNYKVKYFPSEDELSWAKNQLLKEKKPILAICTKSKEIVKNWPEENWGKLIDALSKDFNLLQLGDSAEPEFQTVKRYAGICTMRESASLLAFADLFIGPDSLLMHLANGLNIPSVIIFGGSRPVRCFGYAENTNLESSPNCSPCWIHQGYESCNHDVICMEEISVEVVLQAVLQKTKILINPN